MGGSGDDAEQRSLSGCSIGWPTVRQETTVLAEGASGVVWIFFLPISHIFSFSRALGDGPIQTLC